MTIAELREKRKKAWEAAKAFLDSHRGENGILSAEDSTTYDRMETEINDLGREITRLERAEEMERQMNQPTSTPLVGQPGSPANAGAQASGRASDEYRRDFMSAVRSRFSRVTNLLQESVDADGGYLVPEVWDERLVKYLEENNVMRSLASVVNTTGLTRINVVASKPTASWIEESGELTFGEEPKFGQKTLDAYKLYAAVKVTNELLFDNAYDLETNLVEMFGDALANAEEDAFLNGDGSGKPTGIFDTTNGGTITALAEVTADNLIDLVYSLKRPYRKNAAFIVSDATIATIRKFTDSNGMYIWQPSYQAGEPDKLLGYPVYTSAYAATGDVAFGDYSYYKIGDRGQRSLERLNELFAANDQTGFVVKERTDGTLTLKEAVQILKGSATA